MCIITLFQENYFENMCIDDINISQVASRKTIITVSTASHHSTLHVCIVTVVVNTRVHTSLFWRAQDVIIVNVIKPKFLLNEIKDLFSHCVTPH